MHTLDSAIHADTRRRRRLMLLIGLSLSIGLTLYLLWSLGVRSVVLQILPQEAAANVSITDQQGLSWRWGQRLYWWGDTLEATLVAETFFPYVLSINQKAVAKVTVVMQPLPARLRIQTAPAYDDIRWSINGAWVSTGAALDYEIPAGEVTVGLSHPFIQDISEQFSLQQGEERTLLWSLTAVQGSVRLASTPAGANVRLNDEDVGTTPWQATLTGGQYRVELRHPQQQPLQDQFSITQQQPQIERHYALQAQQGILHVQTAPAGGVLFVNGVPVSSPATVPAGVSHEVRYEQPGYIAQSQTVTLAAGETAKLNFNLQPSLGQVKVNATPSATVVVNGQSQGTTPLTLSLPSVATTLRLQREGYRTVEKQLLPSPKQPLEVNENLLTEFAARRQEGSPLFVDTLGITLLPVAPGRLLMGSPVNEPFRAPNETQYEVRLARPFLLSTHEITDQQYAAFDPQHTPTGPEPVSNISWLQAAQFANWLSQQEGLPVFYLINNGRYVGVNKDSPGYRLPTEAEWEYVAKHYARSTPTQYVWGSQDVLRRQQGNFADKQLKGQQPFVFENYDDGFAGKAPVGSFRAERSGFFDLDGNVREWVHDYYRLSPEPTTGERIDYLGPTQGETHVIKGAGYLSGRMRELRASIRDHDREGKRDVGFRVARYQEASER